MDFACHPSEFADRSEGASSDVCYAVWGVIDRWNWFLRTFES